MRRTIALILALGAAALMLVACSSDPTPSQPDSQFDSALKRPPILDITWSPLWDEIMDSFDDVNFVPVTVQANRSGGDGIVSAMPAGYPANLPIKVTIKNEDDLRLVGDGYDLEWEFTIWVPEVPLGNTLLKPGNCLIYRIEDMPPNVESVEIAMPVLSWNGFDAGIEECANFRIGQDQEGHALPEEVSYITLTGGPYDPSQPCYVNTSFPGLGEPSDMSDWAALGCDDDDPDHADCPPEEPEDP